VEVNVGLTVIAVVNDEINAVHCRDVLFCVQLTLHDAESYASALSSFEAHIQLTCPLLQQLMAKDAVRLLKLLDPRD
jgi:hypothetical protein